MNQLFPFSVNDPIPFVKQIKEITSYGFINERNEDIVDLGLGSSGCFPLGFDRPDIIDNVSKELKKYPFCQSDFATTNPAVNELSEKLYTLSQGYDVIYSMSGSDAIEAAVKLSKMYNPNRKTILGFPNSYHGSTYMSASVSGSTYLTDTFGKHQDCKIIETLDDITTDTLAVIIETCSWQNGLIPNTLEFWQELRNRCDQTDTLLIIDDIAFCNGKTGKYFGWQVTGITPDIFCIGKGITGGFHPLSATLMNSKVSARIKPQVLLHGFAYSFPMAGIISALEFLKIIKQENILEKHQSIVDRMRTVCDQLKDQAVIKDYRNFGVCFNLILTRPFVDLWDKDQMFYQHGLHMGVWNNYKEGILIMLPLNATEDYFISLEKRLRACLTSINKTN